MTSSVNGSIFEKLPSGDVTEFVALILTATSEAIFSRTKLNLAILGWTFCGQTMDQMMSYCAHTANDSVEAIIDYSPSKGGIIQYCNDYDSHNGPSDLERDLLKQCDNYRAQIKRQEEEINSYREHIEVIEEEYSKLSTHLSAAEKNIRQNEKQLCSYQETIGSLKNELDSFYQMEKSFHESNTPLSEVSLSFSNDSNIKMYHNDDSAPSDSDNNTSPTSQDTMLLLDSYKKMCLENMELKRQNDFLNKEVNRLKKDNEDFQDILSSKRPQDFAINSTPIKNLNFISYQALNLDNNSFSIDEDYEADSVLFDRKFRQNLNSAPNEKFDTLVSNVNTCGVKEVTCIANQELPSCILKVDITQPVKVSNLPKCLFSELATSPCPPYEVSSIQDEKLPHITIPDYSTSDKSSRASPSALDEKNRLADLPCALEQFDHKMCQVQIKPQPKQAEVVEKQLSCLQVFICRLLAFILIVFSFTDKFKVSNFKRLSNLDILNSRKLSYFVTLIITIIIWKTMILLYPNIYLQTRLVPFYSIQEIVFDIVSQFCLVHF